MQEIVFEEDRRNILSQRMEPVRLVHVIHPEVDGENGELWIEKESNSTPGFHVICIRQVVEHKAVPGSGSKTFSTTDGRMAYGGHYRRRR